jgi:hypothetical protein
VEEARRRGFAQVEVIRHPKLLRSDRPNMAGQIPGA